MHGGFELPIGSNLDGFKNSTRRDTHRLDGN
jgi:hypothetical protein